MDDHPTIVLSIPMVPDRRMAHNSSRGKSMWTMGDWIKADRAKAHLLTKSIGDVTWRDDLPPHTGPVKVTVRIYWGKAIGSDGRRRQSRRFDWDTATALCKPMIDGALVDTGIIADDRQIVSGTVLQDIDPDGAGFTEIEIVRAVARQEAA